MLNTLKFIIIICFFYIFFTSTSQAEEKYIMKSGKIYYGTKEDENDTYVRIKDFDTQFIISLNKQEINTIEPLLLSIETNQGSQLSGFIISKNDKSYKIKTTDNIIIDIDRAKVRKISYTSEQENTWPNAQPTVSRVENNQKRNQINTNDDSRKYESKYSEDSTNKNKSELGDNFAYAGFALGTPAGINFVGAYHLDYATFQLSGAIGGVYSGAQSAFYLNLIEVLDNKISLKIGLCSGFRLEAQIDYHSEPFYRYDNYNKEYVLDYSEIKYVNQVDYYYYGGLVNINIYGFFLEAGISNGIYVGSEVQFLGQIGFNYRFDL